MVGREPGVREEGAELGARRVRGLFRRLLRLPPRRVKRRENLKAQRFERTPTCIYASFLASLTVFMRRF